jgi:hypothetical protein
MVYGFIVRLGRGVNILKLASIRGQRFFVSDYEEAVVAACLTSVSVEEYKA